MNAIYMKPHLVILEKGMIVSLQSDDKGTFLVVRMPYENTVFLKLDDDMKDAADTLYNCWYAMMIRRKE